MALDSSNLFSLKAVPQATQDELRNRGSQTWNSSLGQAKTWIQLTSMAEGADWYKIKSYRTYAEAYSSLALNDKGEGGRVFYNRPNLTVESLKISAKGEYGTTRSATLQLLVFSDEELNLFSSIFLIPDMSVRVEFGWSVDTKGATPGNLYSGGPLDADAIKGMQKIGAGTPIYEGYQGRVTGWDVKLRPVENVWEISLTLVGAADAVAEVSISSFDDNCNCEKKVNGQTAGGDDQEVTTNERTSTIYAALLELYEDSNAIDKIKPDGYSGEFHAEKIAYPGFSRDETGQEDSDGFLWIDADLDAEETFISWGTVESLLSAYSAQPVAKDNQPQAFVINSAGITIGVPKQNNNRWFSSDPRICILPGGGLQFKEPTEWTDIALGIVTLGYSFIAERTFDQAAGNSYGKASKDCFEDDNHIRLTDIMVSTIHLMKRIKEFEQSKTGLMQALTTILKDINVACGSVWELEVIDVTEQEGSGPAGPIKLAIVDTNSPGSAANNPFTFIATPGQGGFCRDINLGYKPTDAMKTQALYGANGKLNDAPSGAPCNTKFIMYTRNGPRNTGKEQADSGTRSAKYCNDGKKCNPENEKEDPVEALSNQAVGINIDSARAYLEEEKRKAEVANLEAQNLSSYCKQSILPMNFSATITGIGGFRWGQNVTCDRIPEEMRKVVRYQVTTVEHSVTPDDWVTTINTVARLK